MRVISRRARPPVSSKGASSPYSSTSVRQGSRDQLRQVADPATELVVRTRPPCWPRPRRYSPPIPEIRHPTLQKFSDREPGLQTTPHPEIDQGRRLPLQTVLCRPWGVQPDSGGRVLAEGSRRAGQNFGFGAAHIGQQSLRWKGGPRRPINSTIAPTGTASKTTWLPRTATAGSACASSIAPRSRARFNTGVRSQPRSAR